MCWLLETVRYLHELFTERPTFGAGEEGAMFHNITLMMIHVWFMLGNAVLFACGIMRGKL